MGYTRIFINKRGESEWEESGLFARDLPENSNLSLTGTET